jgi:hypothetical protein
MRSTKTPGLRHTLREGDPLARESLAFMLQIPEADVAAAIYTWVNGQGVGGSSVVVFGPGIAENVIVESTDGVAIADDVDFDDWQVGALRVQIDHPMESALVTFDGDRLGLAYRFVGTHPAYLYSSHRDGSPAFFADDRYEQSGRVTGELRIDGKVIALDTTAHRDHSWGTRDWEAVLHYKWVVCEAGPTSAAHFFEIQALGRRFVRGYVYKDELMSEAVDVGCSFDHDNRWCQQHLQATITDALGRNTLVTAKTFASFATAHGPLRAIETGMTVEIDGQPGIGHVEMAWPKSYLRHLVSTNVKASADD